MVIFTRAFDLLTWLLPRWDRLPKEQRFVVTRRLQDAMLDFQGTYLTPHSRHLLYRSNSPDFAL